MLRAGAVLMTWASLILTVNLFIRSPDLNVDPAIRKWRLHRREKSVLWFDGRRFLRPEHLGR